MYQVNNSKFNSLSLANEYARKVGGIVRMVWS
jgi:hypothetical protein